MDRNIAALDAADRAARKRLGKLNDQRVLALEDRRHYPWRPRLVLPERRGWGVPPNRRST